MREVMKLTAKLFLCVLLLSGSVLKAYNVGLTTGDGTGYIVGNWTPDSGEFATGNVVVEGITYAPVGGNAEIGIIGGALLDLSLHDGCITLTRDLLLTGSIGFFSNGVSGTITTDQRGKRTLFLSTDQTLSQHITFTGTDFVLDGGGCEIMFDNAGTFSVGYPAGVGAFTSLTLRDMVLSGLPDSWLYLENGGFPGGVLNLNTFYQTSTVTFDNVIFDSNPYSGHILTWTSNIISFSRDKNMFNAGLTIPNDLALATKFPFSGTLNFNDRTLTLNSDIFLEGGALSGNGTIATDSDSNLRTLRFNTNQTYGSILSFSNSSVIDGGGYEFDLDDTGSLSVAAGKTLHLKDMILKGLKTSWLFLEQGAVSEVNFDNVVFESDPNSSSISTLDVGLMTFTNDCVFEAGFTLPRYIRLATKMPFSGTLDFNGKKLIMHSDLILAADGLLDGNGTIESDADANKRTIYLNYNQSYDNILSFSNNIILDGNSCELNLNSLGRFTVAAGKTLTLRNIRIKNLRSDWINDSTRLVLGRNVELG